MPRGRLFKFLDPDAQTTMDLVYFGFTIVKVTTPERAAELASEAWSDLEGLETGIDRHDKRTWKNDNWPQTTHGLLQNQGAGLWRGTCMARLETVPLWTTLFQGAQPLLSFDALSVARPDSQDRTFKKESKDEEFPNLASWLHTDQAKFKTQCMHHFQGALALTELGVAEQRTQLVIPPLGETMQSFRDRFIAQFPPEPIKKGKFDPERSEWILHSAAEKRWLVNEGRVITPTLKPGEMVIWDSGVPHASIPGPLPMGQAERRVRMSCFVSAVPIAIVDPADIEVRKNMLEKGLTSGHRVTEKGPGGKFNPCKFGETGRTWGKKLPDFSKKRKVSDFADHWVYRGDGCDEVAVKIAKYCGGH